MSSGKRKRTLWWEESTASLPLHQASAIQHVCSKWPSFTRFPPWSVVAARWFLKGEAWRPWPWRDRQDGGQGRLSWSTPIDCYICCAVWLSSRLRASSPRVPINHHSRVHSKSFFRGAAACRGFKSPSLFLILAGIRVVWYFYSVWWHCILSCYMVLPPIKKKSDALECGQSNYTNFDQRHCLEYLAWIYTNYK